MMVFNLIRQQLLGALLVAGALLMSGCTRSILYGTVSEADAGQPSATGPLRLYFDRDGSLYPDAAAGIKIVEEDLGRRHGFLFEYFTSNTSPNYATRRAQQNTLWQYYAPNTAPGTLDLADSTRKRVWRNLQQVMRRRAAEALTQQLKTRKPDVLVVLIHGFNTNPGNTREWYDSVATDVRRYYTGKRVQFLEVYWDGGTSWSPLPLKLWGYAQRNMYGVGLGLRQVLAGVEPGTFPATRILTHSTGGPLLCVALWNSTSALPPDKGPEFWGQQYRWLQRQPAFATPILPQLRIAMLAPAMPGAHFHEFRKRNPGSPGDSTGRCERIIFGQNRHDIATGKTILVSSKWSWIGATSLGVRQDEYCNFVRPEVDGKPYVTTRSFLLDFTGRGMGYHAHGVLEFRKNTGAYRDLFDLWLGTTLPTASPPWRVGCAP